MSEIKQALSAVSHKRICDCPAGRLSCLRAPEWFSRQTPVWEFEYTEADALARALPLDIFPVELAEAVIELFTHEGELVLDPFCGSGTSLLAAKALMRSAVGIELAPEYAAFSRRRISQLDLFSQQRGIAQLVFDGDAFELIDEFDERTIKLVLTAPFPLPRAAGAPNAAPRDIGAKPPTEAADALAELLERLLPKLAENAHIVLVLCDIWSNNRLIPRHVQVLKAMEARGFELRNIIIWDKRNIYSKLGIYGYPSNYIAISGYYEYILDFRVNTQK